MRILLLALVFGLIASTILADDASRTFHLDGKCLLASKAKYKAADPGVVHAVKDLVEDADKALKSPNYSVVNKELVPPSGDKHDYASLSPYWWPDPAKSDGKPYIRKDGQVNPERLKYDQPALDEMTSAVETLALAYYFTGDEKYSDRAAEMIRAWYFDDATKMNPNCRYSQFVPGIDSPKPSGCIETNKMRSIIDADGLLTGSKAWPKENHEKLAGWFKEFLKYLQTSQQARKERDAPNNHGSWYAVQAGTYAQYLGDDDFAKKLVDEQAKQRIKSQIEPDGNQPFEMVRTKAYDYCRFNLEALENLAIVADREGVDLWNFKTDDGRCLRVALDRFAPYASGEKPWEGQQITDPKMPETARVYRMAANAYHEPKYEEIVQAAKKRGKIPENDRLDLVLPAVSEAK